MNLPAKKDLDHDPGRQWVVTTGRPAKRRKLRWLWWVGGAILLVFVALGIAITVAIRRAEPVLRAAIVEKLEEHFHARVELDSFHVALRDGIWAEGKGLRIWPPASVAGVGVAGVNGAVAKPVISLDEFRFHAPLHYKPGEPIRISVVQLNGLNVDIPAKPHFKREDSELSAAPANQGRHSMLHFEVDSIDCKNARLTIETSKPGKLPLEFAIAHVRLSHVGVSNPMHFDAQLTNPRPQGTIVTSGSLGPWAVDDPGETPIDGSYRFENADLGVFKGIAGTLNSTGTYQGALRNMEVDGQTTTPNFSITQYGTALPLETTFHATVDGTNGDTFLHPVLATLGQSHFTAEGEIVGVPAETLPNGTVRAGGHRIALNVNIPAGRMEDFLRLTSSSGTPILTGTLALKTKLEIPPGSDPVPDKLKLDGNFVLDDASFTSEKIQHEVVDLSMRGQGQPKAAKKASDDDVHSTIQSNFTMGGGVIAFPNLKYTVPGAEVDLRGTYKVNGGVLDFKGTARTEATVSKMVGGWKGFLLKPADPFFKKDGAGTLVPIHVDGTVHDPHFGVDLKKMGHTSPQIPGQSQ